VNKRVELTKQPRKPWQKSILQGFDSTLVNVLLYGVIIANTGVIVAELALPSDEKTFDDAQKSQKVPSPSPSPFTLALTLILALTLPLPLPSRRTSSTR